MVRIGINPEKKILTIIEDNESENHKFTDIFMSKDKPLWRVELADGGVLFLNFEAN